MKPTPIQNIARLMQLPTASNVLVQGAAVDTRLISQGNLFFALPGAQTDGHAFLAEAAAKGACAAVVSNAYRGPSHGLHLIESANVLESLQTLAKDYLQLGHAKVIGVTGSLGKTTTKSFLSTLLKRKFTVSHSPGNSNSQIGLPLTILNQTNLDDDEVLILEMGMTHKGQISKLVEIAPPHVAIITSVELVHACNFDSIHEIASAKAEIFTHRATQMGIYPKECDVEHFLFGMGSCNKLSFSADLELADYFLQLYKGGMRIKCPQGDSVELPILELLGDHNRHNFLASAVAARYFGMEWEEIREMQPSLVLPERRLQVVEKLGVTFINDSYNASEKSLKSALKAIPEPAKGRKKIAVIGEMLELGKFSRDCHHEVGKYALQYVDSMFCLGQGCAPIFECWQNAKRPVLWTQDRSRLVEALHSQLMPGDVVLLKGSRPNGLWNILDEYNNFNALQS